jgi:hypothetical protein
MASVGLRHTWLPVLSALCLAGCLGGDNDGPAQKGSEQLLACGFITEGYLRAEPLYLPDDCYESCYGEATCDELEEALCNRDIELLRRCDERCAYHCPEGALIPHAQLCDGNMNCMDGADEMDCETFECDDASMELAVAARCNGFSQCPDGSDERDCEPMVYCNEWSTEDECPRFACANGMGMLPLAQRCDGTRQCVDASDELDCGQVTLRCEEPAS